LLIILITHIFIVFVTFAVPNPSEFKTDNMIQLTFVFLSAYKLLSNYGRISVQISSSLEIAQINEPLA